MGNFGKKFQILVNNYNPHANFNKVAGVWDPPEPLTLNTNDLSSCFN